MVCVRPFTFWFSMHDWLTANCICQDPDGEHSKILFRHSLLWWSFRRDYGFVQGMTYPCALIVLVYVFSLPPPRVLPYSFKFTLTFIRMHGGFCVLTAARRTNLQDFDFWPISFRSITFCRSMNDEESFWNLTTGCFRSCCKRMPRTAQNFFTGWKSLLTSICTTGFNQYFASICPYNLPCGSSTTFSSMASCSCKLPQLGASCDFMKCSVQP